MAQDSYRGAPEQQPLDTYPEPKHSQTSVHPTSTYPPLHYPASERQRHGNASPGQRSRMDSIPHRRSPQPINDAVNSAFDKAEASSALPPEVLSQLTSQITASVLQQLKATTTDSPAPTQASNTPAPAPALASTNGAASSTSVHSDNSPPLSHSNLYTPPSPHRLMDEAVLASPISPTKSTHSAHGRHSPSDHRTPTSPVSQTSQSEEVRGERAERPKAPTRKPTEITTLEKIWGPLFEGARPTPRLGQFLQGLALHLIEDYEPKYSLVITPSKMQKYYEDTKLTPELYPWQTVFDDRTSSISRLYRDVEAQHHLVQEKLDERPDIPGLTPLGFERWTTLMLLAHPEQEFERLQKAVLDMPVCNFHDRKERFPKEISRRLFPKVADQNVRERLERAMATHCNISLLNRWTSGSDQGSQHSQATVAAPRADSIASNTSSQTSMPLRSKLDTGLSTATPGSNTERDRQHHASVSSEGAIEEEDDHVPTPQPIERERKPYAAQPGGGRNYDDIHRPSSPPDPRNAGPPSTSIPTSSAKLGRSASTAGSSSRPADPQRSQPIPVNLPQYSRQPAHLGMEGYASPDSIPSTRHRANSLLNHHHPSGRAMRHRSPSANTKGGDYHRSASEVSLGPTFQGPYGSSPGGDVGDDARRHRDYERPYPSDRHEPMRTSMYEMPAREREARARYQPNAGYGDSSRGHYSSDEDYYRSTGGRSHNGFDGQQYYR